MGEWPARITADDFLTPPELRAGASRQRAAAGRIGGVRLELIQTAGGTRLGRAYQQVPLRILPPFQFGPTEPALLYLLNPTAGLLDGDAQLVQVEAGPGTRTVVAGQSATRIHPSVGGFSTQQWAVTVHAGAVLVILPGPAIPFRGCRYYQRAEIDLAEGAGFVWADLWHAGRYARGAESEQFQFQTLVQEVLVRRGGRLMFRDRFHWQGPWDGQTAAWHFGGAPACASLFATGPKMPGLCSRSPCASFRTAFGDSCVRWHGTSEAVTAAVVETALRTAAGMVENAADRPWLLSTHALAPNHWFSSFI